MLETAVSSVKNRFKKSAMPAAIGSLLPPLLLRARDARGAGESPYAVGEKLPANVAFTPVPARIMVRLGAAPKGCTYSLIGQDILLVASRNRRVIGILSADL